MKIIIKTDHGKHTKMDIDGTILPLNGLDLLNQRQILRAMGVNLDGENYIDEVVQSNVDEFDLMVWKACIMLDPIPDSDTFAMGILYDELRNKHTVVNFENQEGKLNLKKEPGSNSFIEAEAILYKKLDLLKAIQRDTLLSQTKYKVSFILEGEMVVRAKNKEMAQQIAANSKEIIVSSTSDACNELKINKLVVNSAEEM